MPFFQSPPTLGNQFDDDRQLIEYTARVLPQDVMNAVRDEYRELGELSGGRLYRAQLTELDIEPTLTQWDAWGHRVDRIDVSPLWREAQVLAAERGLVAAGYETTFGPWARVHQFVLNYLLGPSTDTYACPLAMTDGAARTLLASRNQALIDRAVTRLTSRDPNAMWTSGQWMTERTGGSDVGISETIARRTTDGDANARDGWRLSGTKWFTSATTSDIALALARPESNGPGGRGLALFYIELRDEAGRMRDITVNRLKDKFGTRKLPTAELTLHDTPATLVSEAHNGVRNIVPMLEATRIWNAVIAASGMRRAVALAKDYATRRRAFGATLAEKPLHVDTLAGMQAEAEAATALAFRTVELLGRQEAGIATKRDEMAARVLIPLAKLTTGKQAVAVASEALEAFGGAGYVNDTGLPKLLADAQVLPIWEGTTNVLSLDTLRALAKQGAFEAACTDIREYVSDIRSAELSRPVQLVERTLKHATAWLARAMADRDVLEAGARRFAITLGRTAELALLTHHAQWCADHDHGRRASAVARRFAEHSIDVISDTDPIALATDAALIFGAPPASFG